MTSVSPASGSVFSLLPPDNATGNFTKIVQRLTVRHRPARRRGRPAAAAARHVGHRRRRYQAACRARRKRPAAISQRRRHAASGNPPAREVGVMTSLDRLGRASGRPVPVERRRKRGSIDAAPPARLRHDVLWHVHGIAGHPDRLFVAFRNPGWLSASADEVPGCRPPDLIAEVIAIPLSGFLSRALGTRVLFTGRQRASPSPALCRPQFVDRQHGSCVARCKASFAAVWCYRFRFGISDLPRSAAEVRRRWSD